MHRPLVLAPGLVVPDAALTWRFSRSSGPGGQSVNTADSRVELSVDLEAIPWRDDAQRDQVLERLRSRRVGTVVTVTASEHRAQLRNREAALARLLVLLTDAVAPPDPPRRPTRPSRASRERRVRAQRRRQEIKALRRRPDHS